MRTIVRNSYVRVLGLLRKSCDVNCRYFSSKCQEQSKIWSGFLSNTDETRKIELQRIQDTLIKSQQPRKSIGGGDILPEALASDFFSYYQNINSKIDKLKVFTTLAQDLGLNHDMIINIAEDIKQTKQRGSTSQLKLEEKLQHSLEPPYIELLSYIGRQEGGVKFIVDLRKDLLDILSDRDLACERDELMAVNYNIRHLLSKWFSVGFLDMQRMTWQSPCDITEKVASYEAVHEVRNWMDMKRRIGPYRRCFVFLHPSMPREPVCVLHIALRDEIPGNIQKILAEEIPSDERDVEKKNTAVFYSVTSTQKGLAEIDLGHSLIMEAVNQLKYELPNIKTFVSLSPIPGFYKWLDQKLLETSESSVIAGIMNHKSISSEGRKVLENILKKPYNLNFKNLISNPAWLRNEQLCDVLQKPLLELCASYLCNEKKKGFALDPVANFHLRNGAILWRLNWKADVSRKGALRSLGMMVNYKYSLNEVHDNNRQYVLRGEVATSKYITDILADKNFNF
ncbi:malonyl-CoA decarboxylase, mitochondrial-like isoform X2 [Dendronephthya gigantea]|uniref:malonyl-CoA decarboxylase, mitochondrial-like isoform X2 n=1 Tax=Dendronephthya gigantea TaxID=151771 RepID=UPI00106C29C7|nr:malonyl-CoA decarboxylase, mitochondrial-like isoform X2 [Dendronephthya gigantea]